MSQSTREIKRAVIYVRWSKERDLMTTDVTQEAEARKYAAFKGWEVVKVLTDPGRSAYKKNVRRPEHDEALSMIERHEADVILVFKLDRFSRSLSDFWNDWQDIKTFGGHFASCVEQFDTSTTMGELMLMVVAAFAQMESEMKRDRALPMHRHQKETGKVAPGPRSYGYQRINSEGDGATLVIDQEEATILRDAVARIIKGDDLRAILRDHQPKSTQSDAKGNRKPMTVRGLRSIILSPTSAGLRSLDDDYVQGCWEPIIDRDAWEAARVVLHDPKRKTSNSNQIGYLLSSIMMCEKCEGPTTGRNWVDPRTDRATKRYQCRKCGVSIDLDAAEQLVTKELFELVPESVWDAWMTSGKGWDEAVITKIKKKLATVDKQWADDKISDDRWMNLTAEYQAQLDSAQNNEALDLPIVPNLRHAWGDMTLLDRRKVIKQAFHGVRITLVPFNGSTNVIDRIEYQEAK